MVASYKRVTLTLEEKDFRRNSHKGVVMLKPWGKRRDVIDGLREVKSSRSRSRGTKNFT